jgi:predicted DNA-binding transcriptional regulator AlpA
MRDRLAEIGARYVRTHEAARLLGISPRTLEKYRYHGNSPTVRKLGGRVAYAVDDLEAWADQAACRSTSDPRYVEARAAGRANAPGSASIATQQLPR